MREPIKTMKNTRGKPRGRGQTAPVSDNPEDVAQSHGTKRNSRQSVPGGTRDQEQEKNTPGEGDWGGGAM